MSTNDVKMANALKKKYPNRIPIIVTPLNGLKLTKTKFLVPGELTMTHFMTILRKYTTLKSCHALFIFVKDLPPANNKTLFSLYKENFESEGAFTLSVTRENTFGC
mgnify:CR=1 FL=1|tara:strand:- start:915 stop:1232 length:318 start_codon:yes stop_codon:yes gene_type:complete